MSVKSFLAARWPWIAAYAAFALLAGAVVVLDLRLSGARLRPGNILYILILGVVVLGAALALDYRRHAAFAGHLARITGSEDLDHLGVLPDPRTPEQELFVQAWQRLYARLRAQLSEERERGQRHVQLVTQWAHHMKTPVAVIDLELQRLERSAGPAARPEAAPQAGRRAPDDITAALASIREENQRLSHALQMLLNTVRLQDFAADFKVERVDLLALVRDLINDHRREFIVHRVYPRVEVASQQGGSRGGPGGGEPTAAPAPWQVESDAKWLRFALEQITSNAVKYTAGAGVDPGRITFVLRRDEDDAAVVLDIADNGVGIPPEDLPRVFNPFFTGSAGRRFPQSTGMGLYLVREVCRRLGHRVTIESAPGRGTRVSIRFPGPQTIFAGLDRQVLGRAPILRDR